MITSRISSLLRGSLYVALTVAVLAGPPILLLALRGWPIPSHLPEADELRVILTSRDDGTLAVRTAVVIAWAGWAALALALVVEAIAAVRQLQAPRLPGLGAPQKLAASMIASITLAFASHNVSTTAMETASAAVTRTATPSGEQDGLAHGGDERTATEQQRPKLRIVREGDTLWDIARDEYGSGSQYPRIYKASKDLRQPPGVPRLTDPDLIYPRERLEIPENGKPQPRRNNPDHRKSSEHPQKPSSPAPRTSPPTATPTSPKVTSPTPSTSVPAPSSEQAEESPTEPQPRTKTPPSPGRSPSPSPNEIVPVLPETQAPSSPAANDDDGIPVFRVIGFSGLAAAGLLALLALKRLIQQRRRRPGHRIRIAPQVSTTEQQLHAAGEPGSVTLLDTALRSLAAQLHETGQQLPKLNGARVTGTGVELLLPEPTKPAEPFTSRKNDRTWTLDRSSAALLSVEATAGVPAPYPSLVTLGDDESAAHVLADLETAGSITLTGSYGEVCEVLTAMALELATSPWADHIEIICAAFAPELPHILDTGRLRYADTPAEALTSLEARARDITAALAGSGTDSVRQARSDQIAADTWSPQIILSAVPLARPEQERLGALVTGAGSLAAIVSASDEPGQEDSPWLLDAATARPVRIEPLDATVTMQRITQAQYSDLLQDLGTADDTISSADPQWHSVPPEPETPLPPVPQPPASNGSPAPAPTPGDLAEIDPVRSAPAITTDDASVDKPARAMNSDPEILVLGRVEITGRDTKYIEPGKRNLLPELATYLKLNPGRSTEEISRALGGPRRPWSASTRASNISRLRAWLGHDDSGDNYLPVQAKGRPYALSAAISCDWHRFQDLAKRGLSRRDEGVTDLTAALDLVRGQPFAGAGPNNYIWAEPLKQEMISAITDVAHTLATLLTEAGDPTAARIPVAKGLEIEPGSELLYRDLIRAEFRAGNLGGIMDAIQRLTATLHELGLEMEPETAELIDNVRSKHRKAAERSRPVQGLPSDLPRLS